MSKAKEKAKDLVLQYKNLINFYFVSGLRWRDPSHANNEYHERVKKDAKKCAKIAVKEIILTLERELLDLYEDGKACPINHKFQNFYLDVLKEIDNV